MPSWVPRGNGDAAAARADPPRCGRGAGSEADTPAPEPAEEVTIDPEQPPYETRPRFSRGDEVPLLRNDELARIFFEIGDMLEIQGEMPFKVGAYRRAAESIAAQPARHRRGLPARQRRRGSRASARPSTRSWPSWPTPAGCATTSGCGATCRHRW